MGGGLVRRAQFGARTPGAQFGAILCAMRRLRYAIFCFDQVYIKHAVDSVPVESNWGRVFYTNFWASLIMR